MTPKEDTTAIKFRLILHPWDGVRIPAERLWGHWLDEEKGLVSCRNNANQAPLVVNDTVRVERDKTGMWQLVEVVRLCESIVSMTSFEPPMTVEQALKIYDGWLHEGKTVYSEGGYGMISTAWKEFMPLKDVHATLLQSTAPGWEILGVLTPDQRMQELTECVDFTLNGSE